MKAMNPPDQNRESSTDEILDWYLPEKTGVSQRSPYQQSASQKPSHFQTMIQKLHIGTTLAALVLFFLP